MKINKGLMIPFGLAGTSIGLGIIGEKIDSPGLKEGGADAGKFIAPSVNIFAGGYLINQLRKFPKKL
jgi:hypothetical protein